MGQSGSAFPILFAPDDATLEDDDDDADSYSGRQLYPPTGRTGCCGSSPFSRGLSILSYGPVPSYRGTVDPVPAQAPPLYPYEKPKVESVSLRSCREGGWKSSMESIRRRRVARLTADITAARQKQTSNGFTAVLGLYQAHWELDNLIRRTELQVTDLREWVTYFISPLISLDTILKTVVRDSHTDDDQPQYCGTAVDPTHLGPSTSYQSPSLKAEDSPEASGPRSGPLEDDDDDKGRCLEPASVARWVAQTFPFLKEHYVVAELDYLHRSVHVDGKDGHKRVNACRVSLDVLELLFKKQLPSFLEGELQAASDFLRALQLMDRDVNRAIQDIRLDLKHAYVTLMSQRLLLDPAHTVTLENDHVTRLFNSPSSLNISKYIHLAFTTAPSGEGVLDFLTVPRHSKPTPAERRHPSPLVSVTSTRSSLFPVPPLPPTPAAPADPHIVTMKSVDIFLQRCFVEQPFFKAVVTQYQRDHPADLPLGFLQSRKSSFSSQSSSSSVAMSVASHGISAPSSYSANQLPFIAKRLPFRCRSVHSGLLSRFSTNGTHPPINRSHTWIFETPKHSPCASSETLHTHREAAASEQH